MSEEQLREYWYSVYVDAYGIIKNAALITEKNIVQMTEKYNNTEFVKKFGTVVWKEVCNIRNQKNCLSTDKYYAAITDVWRVFKAYSKIEDTDDFWTGLVSEIKKIAAKYDNCQFILSLLVDVTLEEIERLWKERKKSDKS